MGEAGKSIVDLDVEKLIDLLNKALADEWLAYYQYWIGAKLAKGKMRPAVASELEEHAGEELKHANMLVERIIQLGGTPLLDPKEWYDKTNCGYDVPSNPNTVELLKQNIKGERCAIRVYKNILDFVRGKDDITYHMIVDILEDEVEHEEDLESLLEDLE